jgi:divalent metal cation (Fe/Co/Zn/Cd) transporter
MLMDGSISPEIRQEIISLIDSSSTRVRGYHQLRTRVSGKTTFVDMHLVFDADISLMDTHEIADTLEKNIEKLIHGAISTIHLDPYDDHITEK